MTSRSDSGNALRLRIHDIINRPKGLVAWSLTKEVRGPMSWRKAVSDTLRDWRLLTVGSRKIMTAEAELFRSGLAEILALQIEERISPVFRPLKRIEWQAGRLANLRREPWAQSWHKTNQ